jgi:predicted transcriptional regulator
MTEILISIQPKWVEKIMTLAKRWEMRKTMPKTKGPFRCFIYQTEGGGVVGEFVCDSFTEVEPGEITKRVLTDTMLTKQEALDYAAGKTVYLWRIRSLVDYPEPKPLSAYGLERAPQSWCYLKEDNRNGTDDENE